jgi:hypothetical protein
MKSLTSGDPADRDATYAGEWHEGQPEGDGAMTCSDGRKYDGQFRKGLCNGFAMLQCPKVGERVELSRAVARRPHFLSVAGCLSSLLSWGV